MNERMTSHDVIRSTASHIRRVGNLMADAARRIVDRAVNHDESKWSADEYPAFEEATPRLKSLTYGTPEYKAALAMIAPALKHHYAANRHHPEHHAAGLDDMTLLDLIEMLCDWKAAGERHDDGCIERSIDMNIERFKMDPQLVRIFRNTAQEMGWLNSEGNDK